LNKKPTPEDLKVWKEFTSSKETIENKDYYLDQKKISIPKIRKIDLHEKFVNQNSKYKEFFKKIANDKYIFDLRGFINNKISDLNIKNIENVEMNTFTAQETFYSHRRSRLNNEKDYGRCISVILMT